MSCSDDTHRTSSASKLLLVSCSSRSDVVRHSICSLLIDNVVPCQAMAAVAFASERYGTKFVGEAGKPSLAVLSIGCGTSSQLRCDATDRGCH